MFSKTLLVFFVVYFLADFSHGRRHKFFRKDYSYIETEESYYKIHTTPRTFDDAKQMCILEGATLYYPENEVEANAVLAYWKTVQPTNIWSVFIGLTDSISEGNFKTIDGKPISNVHKNWKHGEPDNNGPGEKDCAVMNGSGEMSDEACDLKTRFICKKKDYSYIKATDSYYKMHNKALNFADAKRTCVQEGASFFYPGNDDEAHAVIEFWNMTDTTGYWLYVGISDLMTKGVFETIDGKLIYDVYSQWSLGEPNNLGDNEDCVGMNRQGLFNDVGCDSKYYFICKSSRPSQWNDNCKMPNLDYTLNENTGKCYKLHTTPLTWTEAYAVCRAEQSHLAVINNTLEADYLASLTKSVAKRRVGGTYQRGIYHVGVHNRLNEGWQTVTGQSINDASAWWGNSQPAADDEKKCGSMFYTGLLNNIDCDTKSFFICEHEVDTSSSTDHPNFSSDNEECCQ